jgi:hypothetical protein
MLVAVAWGLFFVKTSYGATVPLDITEKRPFYNKEHCEQARALVVKSIDGWDHSVACVPIQFEVR